MSNKNNNLVKSQIALCIFLMGLGVASFALFTPPMVAASYPALIGLKAFIAPEVVHFAIFAMITSLLLITFKMKTYITAGLAVALAVSTEYIQPIFGRSNEAADLVANIAGITFIIVFKLAIEEHRAERQYNL